jgi:hypothetical protein
MGIGITLLLLFYYNIDGSTAVCVLLIIGPIRFSRARPT